MKRRSIFQAILAVLMPWMFTKSVSSTCLKSASVPLFSLPVEHYPSVFGEIHFIRQGNFAEMKARMQEDFEKCAMAGFGEDK